MATLSLQNRWFPYTPAWLGNRDQKGLDGKPFSLKIKRLTKGELESFREAAGELIVKTRVTAEEIHGVLGAVLQGPVGELEVDGEEVETIGQLCEVASRECPMLAGSLVDELVGAVTAFNQLS